MEQFNEYKEDMAIPSEYGVLMLSWKVDEYPHHERSTRWYVVTGGISLALIVYAILTANFLFALIILMMDIIFLLSIFKKPDQMQVAITTTGVIIGEAYHAYLAIKDFSLVYEPPHVKTLYFDFQSPWRPMISIPLEDVDPNEVRKVLTNFCIENLQRTDETLTDILRRMYKL